MFFDTALAQTPPCPSPPLPCLTPLTTVGSVSGVLLLIINGLLYLAGAIAIIYIMWSGFQFITSAGNPEQAQKGRNGVLYAVIGLVIIALSFAIVRAVGDLVSTTPTTAPNTTGPGSGPGQQSAPGRLPTGGTGTDGSPSTEGPSQITP